MRTILLLQACCFEPEAALKAYQHWKLQTNFEQLDSNQFDLLPHLYQNLSAFQDDLTPRLRGIYKQAWVLQQQRIFNQEQWQRNLEQHGIAYQLLDDAKLSISATSDFAVQNISLLLRVVPSENWLVSKQKYLLHWKIRGWVGFKHSTRVFAQSCPEYSLHRLEYTHNDMVWLTRGMPELQSIFDWQAFFAIAQPFGLRKRLHHLLQAAQEADLLKSLPLNMQFSSLDQMQYQLSQNQSRMVQIYYTWRIKQLKSRSI